MKKRTRILLVAALVPAVVLGIAAPMALASGSSQRGIFDRLSLAAGMKGGNEVPVAPATTAGDPDAAGFGVVDINFSQGQVCVELAVGGADAPLRLFHIHRGGPDVNGPVVVDFTSLLPAAGLPAGELGCVTVNDRRLLGEILLHPGDFYLNAHNDAASRRSAARSAGQGARLVLRRDRDGPAPQCHVIDSPPARSSELRGVGQRGAFPARRARQR